jgi:ElaB/YqjD/DUF883 family membrane-anchored ribosome-binding protein
MKATSSGNVQVIDHLAKTAHEMVDNMHARAVRMEGELTKQSKETSEHIAAEMETRMSKIEGYIAENPMAAAMVAFGLGAFGTQVFKSMSPGQSKQSKSTKDKSVSKAA